MLKWFVGIFIDKLLKAIFAKIGEYISKRRKNRVKDQVQRDQIKEVKNAKTTDERIDSFDNLQ